MKLKNFLTEDEYYIDTTKDDTSRYVAKSGDEYYTGKIGTKKTGPDDYESFLRLVLDRALKHASQSRLNKLKKVSKQQLEKDAGMSVEWKLKKR